MKSFTAILVLVGLISIAQCKFHSLGRDVITAPAYNLSEACLLPLKMDLTQDSLIFTYDVYNPNQMCTYQNLTYTSMFGTDYWVPGQVTMSPTNVTGKYKGIMTWADIKNAEGSVCVNYGLQLLIGRYGWTCRFKLGEVTLQVQFFVKFNGDIDTNWDRLLYPVYGLTETTYNSTLNTWITKAISDQEFPRIVGKLFTQCGGWSTEVTNLNNNLYVTGTNYSDVADPVNLRDMFRFWIVTSAIVKYKNPGAAVPYKANFVGYPAFALPPNGACSNTLLDYDNIINSLNDCTGNGCDLSFILFSSEVYVLQTSGFTTKP